MKKVTCIVSMLSVLALLGLTNRFARSDDEKTATIKEVMQKLHKGPNAALAKLKKDLAADSLDWKDIQAKAKLFETYGAALAENEPPKGEKDHWKRLADSYDEHAKKLYHSAKHEDKDGVQAAVSEDFHLVCRLSQGSQTQLIATRFRARRLLSLGRRVWN